jgi:hypothetical protein
MPMNKVHATTKTPPRNILDIDTKWLDDGTTVITMGNNKYEYPLLSAPYIKKAANR